MKGDDIIPIKSIEFDPEIKELGWDTMKLDLILRMTRNSMINTRIGEDFSYPKGLEKFMPLGNPPKFMAGYAYYDNKHYLSIFSTDDTAVTLGACGDHKVTHPLLYLDTIHTNILYLLKHSNEMEKYEFS